MIFPQYPRLFSAKATKVVGRSVGKFILWTGICLLIVVNISLCIRTPIPGTEKLAAAEHARLAHNFWRSGEIQKAKREIQAIFTYDAVSSQLLGAQKITNILGASDKNKKPTTNSRRQALEINYEYWKTVVAQHPDYRDGYVTLAALAYQLNKPKEARLYIDQTKKLDPNNSTTSSFEGVLPIGE